jgi:preprotein translocase subunit SecE
MADDDRVETEAVASGGVLGIERWVQFGFIALAVIGFWLSDKIITVVWEQFAEPDPTIVAGTAAIIGLIGAFVAYKNQNANQFAQEAAGELSKVAWPSRKETWANTIVVVITSIISAAILFAFDAAWSAITDLIYKV